MGDSTLQSGSLRPTYSRLPTTAIRCRPASYPLARCSRGEQAGKDWTGESDFRARPYISTFYSILNPHSFWAKGATGLITTWEGVHGVFFSSLMSCARGSSKNAPGTRADELYGNIFDEGMHWVFLFIFILSFYW